ncbi:hypothetical protein C8Q70DRAFT_905479 [Cubamyces menziesii]|nr:hypothetical protein C8Q70DRAFT_905479 [Cubamyces menziesii]
MPARIRTPTCADPLPSTSLEYAASHLPSCVPRSTLDPPADGEADTDATPTVVAGPSETAALAPQERKKAKVNNTVVSKFNLRSTQTLTAPKKPSTRYAAFLKDNARDTLDELLELEAGPRPDDRCANCGETLALPSNSQTARVRCYDCFGIPNLCLDCLRKTHRLNPFHHVWRWDATKAFWEKTTTAAVGMRLYGGHNGERCPYATRPPRDLVIVHEHGVSTMPFSFCECPRVPGQSGLLVPEPLQLLKLGLYPASWKEPRTAYTISLLQSCHLLSLQTHCSTEDFYTYLRRLTDNVDPSSVPDRYRELSASMREYAYLRACKRAGRDPDREIPCGGLTVQCPCCPQPGINMRPGWEARQQEYGYVDALFYSIDGNFRQNVRNKAMDKDDVALTRGAGYFASTEDFQRYVKHIGKPEEEKTTCHKFGAMGYHGHSGKVSGIVALACRHMYMLPTSIVDLNKREGYLYVDFAVVSGVQQYVGLQLFKQSYDINCQYLLNFGRRISKWKEVCPPLASIATLLLPCIHGCVGCWHVNAHKRACRVFQSPAFLPGSGRYEGEGLERVWAITNDLSSRTKEMTLGHRHDILNDMYSDLHVRRMHATADTLVQSLEEAERHLTEAEESLKSVEKSIPNATLDEWKRDEAEWLRDVMEIRNHEHMDDPYSPPVDASLSEEAAAAVLKQDYAKTANTSAQGMVSVIQGTIEVERERLALLKSVHACDPNKVRQRNALGKRVAALQDKGAVCRSQYDRYVNEHRVAAVDGIRRTKITSTTATASESTSFPIAFQRQDFVVSEAAIGESYMDILRSIPVELPSTYTAEIRSHPAMAPAVSIERKLREGQANDALNELRAHLTALYSLEDLQKQGTGQAHGKRVRAIAATEVTIGHHARDEYRRVRTILLKLGMPEDDDTYRALTDNDARPFIVFSHQHQRGDSKRPPSWIWNDFSFLTNQQDAEVKDYMWQKLRPFWFRRRAACARWQEEVYIKREEMYRTRKFFEWHRTRWTERARDAEEQGREGAAVFARR